MGFEVYGLSDIKGRDTLCNSLLVHIMELWPEPYVRVSASSSYNLWPTKHSLPFLCAYKKKTIKLKDRASGID